MPKLQDTDWEKITANVGMISFLQGLNIGGKTYNGYTIVTNNKNKEFVSEESIYIENNTNTYHRATDLDLRGTSNATGYFNIDYERRTGEILQTVGGATAQVTGYYNPREQQQDVTKYCKARKYISRRIKKLVSRIRQ